MPKRRNVVRESLIFADSLIKPSTTAVGFAPAVDDRVSAQTASLERY